MVNIPTPVSPPPVLPTSPSASSKTPSPPPPDNNKLKFFDSRRGLLIGAAIVLLVIGLLAFYAKNLKKPAKDVPGKEQEQIVAASPIPGASPPQLPKVKEQSKKDQVRAFFQKASPANFKEVFLDTLPEAAADSYIKYSSAASQDDKQGAARGFYIILNNPGAPSSDPQFLAFTKDVRAELEKGIGKPLF